MTDEQYQSDYTPTHSTSEKKSLTTSTIHSRDGRRLRLKQVRAMRSEKSFQRPGSSWTMLDGQAYRETPE